MEGTETGIVVLAHPSKSGMDTGRNDAGSVAWNATARARISYRIDRDNPEIRHLELAKNNHGSDKLKISVAWRNGTFRRVGLTDDPANTLAERKFLELLDLRTAQGRDVNANSGPNYAPKVFAEHPDSGGISKNGYRHAMDRLFASGKIRSEKKNKSTRIVRTSEKTHTVGGELPRNSQKSAKISPETPWNLA